MRYALLKLRLSSLKLAIVAEQNKKLRTICKYFYLNEDEDETHFILQCRNYKDLWKGLIDYLVSTEYINLKLGNNFKKLKLLFVSGPWGSLNALGKLILKAYKNEKKI